MATSERDPATTGVQIPRFLSQQRGVVKDIARNKKSIKTMTWFISSDLPSLP
jgi:hypothetical protein